MNEPNGNTTIYVYDNLNRLIRKTEPLGNTHHYAYDAVGNRINLTDPNGNTLHYSYDANNRLTAITYPDASTVTFNYDENGNRTRMVDKLGTSQYAYDAPNRMISYTDPFGKTVGYGYDANGNRTTLTYPDGKVVSYTYDSLNRLSRVTDWVPNFTSYNYDVAGNLIGILKSNNTRTVYSYDSASRLIGLSNLKSDASVISSYNYALDSIGNHLQAVQNEPLNPILVPKNIALTYDNENRLTNAGGVAFTYDSNGNLIQHQPPSSELRTYSYDYEDRLRQTAMGGLTSQYGYDGVGNRLIKTEGGVTKRYVLDVNGRLSNVIAETDAVGAITAYYVHGLGLISKVLPDGTTSNYHYDFRGSTIALTDINQNITDAYAYDSFGKLANSSGATPNPFRYVGRYGVMEEGNGLNYVRARYYLPEFGRFITKDPLTGNDTDGQSLNRYVYALNNPVRLIDIDGKIFWVPFAAGAIIGSGISSAAYIIETALSEEKEFKWAELGGVAAGGAVVGVAAVGLKMAAPAVAATKVGAVGIGAFSSLAGAFTEKVVTNIISKNPVLKFSGEDIGEIVADTIAGGLIPGVSRSLLPGIKGAKPTKLITSLIGAHAKREIAESIAESIISLFLRPPSVFAPSNGVNMPFIIENAEIQAYQNKSFFKP
jgi:RHS repeat-associated protein